MAKGKRALCPIPPCGAKSDGVLATNKLAPGPCIRFQKKSGGDMIMVNSCAACKAVVVERTTRTGKHSHQAFAVAPKAYVPVP